MLTPSIRGYHQYQEDYAPAQPWSNCHMNTSPSNAPNCFPGETSFCEPGAGRVRGSANNVDGGECPKASDLSRQQKSPAPVV